MRSAPILGRSNVGVMSAFEISHRFLKARIAAAESGRTPQRNVYYPERLYQRADVTVCAPRV